MDCYWRAAMDGAGVTIDLCSISPSGPSVAALASCACYLRFRYLLPHLPAASTPTRASMPARQAGPAH